VSTAFDRVDGGSHPDPALRARSGGHDLPCELVAHDQRRGPIAHVAEVTLDLRAADPDRARAHHHLVRTRIVRLGPLTDLDLLRTLPNDGLHASPRCRPYTRRMTRTPTAQAALKLLIDMSAEELVGWVDFRY
jgi:hypothetical protein